MGCKNLRCFCIQSVTVSHTKIQDTGMLTAAEELLVILPPPTSMPPVLAWEGSVRAWAGAAMMAPKAAGQISIRRSGFRSRIYELIVPILTCGSNAEERTAID